MAPVQHLAPEIPTDFEVPGIGVANRTIDWVVGPLGGRRTIFDGKRQDVDFINQADQIAGNNSIARAPPPDHDAALLFRSVASKLKSSDPAVQLQGVWINTDIMQDESAFGSAFDALDGTRVHFALLGDWEADVHIVSRRDEDRPFILDTLGVTQSNRFTFSREATNARTDGAASDALDQF